MYLYNFNFIHQIDPNLALQLEHIQSWLQIAFWSVPVEVEATITK